MTAGLPTRTLVAAQIAAALAAADTARVRDARHIAGQARELTDALLLDLARTAPIPGMNPKDEAAIDNARHG